MGSITLLKKWKQILVSVDHYSDINVSLKRDCEVYFYKNLILKWKINLFKINW